PRPDLLVLLQQCGAFGNQRVLALAQGAVFILELVGNQYQFIEAPLKALEFAAEGLFKGAAHGTQYSVSPLQRSNAGWPVPDTGPDARIGRPSRVVKSPDYRSTCFAVSNPLI